MTGNPIYCGKAEDGTIYIDFSGFLVGFYSWGDFDSFVDDLVDYRTRNSPTKIPEIFEKEFEGGEDGGIL